MLTLISFPPALGEPSNSPFCVKAMLLLQMSGEDWEPRFVPMPEGPYGKLPVLETPQGTVPDSALIQRWLEARGADFFPGFDAAARGMAQAVMRMAEDSLRPHMAHDRWLDARVWPRFFPEVFRGMPEGLEAKVQEGQRQGMTWLGIARYSEEDRCALASMDMDALVAVLGEGPWLFGARPTAADASVLPVLSMIDRLPGDTALRRALRARQPLMDYVARGREALYAPLNARLYVSG
ncbi:glutathione S-transferase family protein [Salipiger sp. H15]|uniref:Glutathione S-transferase family protein n=1 Tax=Alloyangia sp. H15 TaxID=3029062 RepID=A0AAU8AJD2_9RHOB